MKDNYIIRITNTSLATNVITLNTAKNSAKFEVPNWLRSKGKCNIKVVGAYIQLQNGGGTRVLANGEKMIVMRSNIPMLGYNTETNGLPNVLGQAVVNANSDRVVALDSVNSLEFTCTQLPPIIEVERMTYKITADFDLQPADNFTTDVVPFQITLQVSFYEDDHKN